MPLRRQSTSSDNCGICKSGTRSSCLLEECQHKYCRQCLQEFIDRLFKKGRVSRELYCPVCYSVVEVPQSDQSPEDWASLFQIKDDFQDCEPMTLANCNSGNPTPCVSCLSEGKEKGATGFCHECLEAYCETCSGQHKKFKITRNHYIQPTSEILICPRHRKEELYYCQEHDEMCCKDCIEKHFRCGQSKYFIPEASRGIKNEKQYTTAKSNAQKLKTHVQRAIGDIQNSLQTTADQETGLITTIEDFRKKINQRLIELEKSLKLQISDICKSETERLERNLLTCITIQEQVEKINNDLETTSEAGIFVSLQSISDSLEQHDRDLSGAIGRTRLIQLDLNVNQTLQDLLKPDSTLGTIKQMKRHSRLPRNCITIPFDERDLKKVRSFMGTDDQERTCFFTGSVILPNSNTILVDHNAMSLTMFDLNYQQVGEEMILDSAPWDITVIDETSVAVTLPNDNAVQFISYKDNKFVLAQKIQTTGRCYGICRSNRNLFITCGENKEAFVQVLTMDGEAVKCLRPLDSRGSQILRQPRYIAVSTDGDQIHVSDSSSGYYCLGIDGSVKCAYAETDFKRVMGITLDPVENVYACCFGSKNIHQLAIAAGNVRNMMQADTNLQSACYDPITNRLVVTAYGCRKVKVYELE